MCADHGVVEEGVTQTGQEVTRIVAENFTKGQTTVTCMCRVSGTDVFPVDVGMTGEGWLWDGSGKEAPAPFVLLNRRAGAGSRNLVREAAMTGDQCEKALLAGGVPGPGSEADGLWDPGLRRNGHREHHPGQRPGLGP